VNGARGSLAAGVNRASFDGLRASAMRRCIATAAIRRAGFRSAIPGAYLITFKDTGTVQPAVGQNRVRA